MIEVAVHKPAADEFFGGLQQAGLQVYKSVFISIPGRLAFDIRFENPPSLKEPQVALVQLQPLGREQSPTEVFDITGQNHVFFQLIDANQAHFFNRLLIDELPLPVLKRPRILNTSIGWICAHLYQKKMRHIVLVIAVRL